MIIGAGVVGCAIARELSRYQAKVCVLERESDLGCGQTGANNGVVHPGIDPPPGTLKARLNVAGNAAFPRLCRELGVPFRRTGLLAVVTDPEEAMLLPLSKLRAEANGVKAEVVEGEDLRRLEPALGPGAYGALWAPDAGITCPFRLTQALARTAARNGVVFELETEVAGMLVGRGRVRGVRTTRGDYLARWVVNCAGVDADLVAGMAGPPEFTIHPRKGEIVVFDRGGPAVGRVLGVLSLKGDPHSKGGGINPAVDGNLLVGPGAREVADRRDTAVSADGIRKVLDKFTRLVPALARATPIAAFAGLRAATYREDFIVRPSAHMDNLLHVAGIQSPGLAASPAIAAMALGQLADMGFSAPSRPDAVVAPPPRLFRELDPAEQTQAAAADPGHRRVVCRCETVTESDVVAALRDPVPATTLEAVKRRTRAGMGRCQGAFCGPRVATLIARERGIPLWEVTRAGPGSWLYAGPTRR